MARKNRSSRNKRADGPIVADCTSPLVQERLLRIEANYARLHELLSELEGRIPSALPDEAMELPPNKPR